MSDLSKSRCAAIALLVSLGLHVAAGAWLLLRAPKGRASRAVVPIEVEVNPVSPKRASPPQDVPQHAPAPLAAAGPSRSRTRSSVTRQPPKDVAASPSRPDIGTGEQPAAREDLPRAGVASGGSLVLGLSGNAARRLTGIGEGEPPHAVPEADAGEAGVVKRRVDSMLAEAQAANRSTLAADGAVQGLGRSFERAATRATLAADLRRRVDSALAAYKAQIKRFGSFGKGEPNEWERIEDRALRQLDRSAATYVAVVELRQASDGRLLDLRLVASSGEREFDTRALSSVADGVRADAAALAKPKPEGALSLWALLGDRRSSSAAVQTAQKAYRYMQLEVVDLKPTTIELERGGATEQIRFSARLLAVF